MPSAEQRRLESLLDRQEATLKDAFRTFIGLVKSDKVMGQVADLLEARNVEAALRLVDTYIVQLGSSLVQVFIGAAAAEVEEAARKLNPTIALSFDASYPRAAELMRRNRFQFVRDFSREQRRATTTALSRAFSEGIGPRDAARSFRDSIGLTERQEEAIGNYARLLRAGSAEALDRELRDRRFDPTVQRAARTGEPLKDAQIARMVERYRERSLMLRSETISRTESVRVTSIARREGFAQAMEDAGLRPDEVVRVWNATNDARTRDSHRAMDGQEVGLEEPFTDGDGNRLMFPGDPNAPPATTVSCRCVVTHRVKQAA